MRTRRDLAIYWTSTTTIAIVLAFGAVNFAVNDRFPEWDPDGVPAFAHLGLPAWFKWELVVAKALAIPVLLLPGMPRVLRDAVYYGFALTLVSAVIAHAASGDHHVSWWYLVQPFVVLTILVISRRYLDRVQR